MQAASGRPHVTVEDRDGVCWVVLRGAIDLRVVNQMPRDLLRPAARRLVKVDLGAVTFLDSMGLNLMIMLRNNAGEVTLVNAPLKVVRLLQVTGVEGLFDYEPAATHTNDAAE